MNYLSGAETQANVPVLWVVARWLNHVGSSSFADLARTLRPPTIVTGAENALRASLLVGRHMGILHAEDESGPWSNGPRLASDAVVDHRSFRAAVREALLAQAVEDTMAGSQPADVAVGLTWLCSLDPTRPVPWGWNDGTERMVRDTPLRRIINNSSQWVAFRRWAVSLGMAVGNTPRGGVQVLIPDPTVAVAETLPSLPVQSTAPVFLRSLAERLPVIDSGSLERFADQLGMSNAARGDATLGPSLAHALRRLDRRGALRLKKSDDASHRLSLRTAHGTDTFDDIEIMEQDHD